MNKQHEDKNDLKEEITNHYIDQYNQHLASFLDLVKDFTGIEVEPTNEWERKLVDACYALVNPAEKEELLEKINFHKKSLCDISMLPGGKMIGTKMAMLTLAQYILQNADGHTYSDISKKATMVINIMIAMKFMLIGMNLDIVIEKLEASLSKWTNENE